MFRINLLYQSSILVLINRYHNDDLVPVNKENIFWAIDLYFFPRNDFRFLLSLKTILV